MPKYSTTTKNVAEGFARKVTNKIAFDGAELELDVHFARPDKGAGWVAYAYGDKSAQSARGANLDAAVDALLVKLAELNEGDDAPKGEATQEEIPAVDDSPKGESTEETAPVMAAAEIGAQGLKVIRDARDAYVSAADQYGNGAGSANREATDACVKIGELSQMITDDGIRARFYEYGTKLAEHYYGRTGGGDRILTGAQRSRAMKKFGKVCAELAA